MSTEDGKLSVGAGKVPRDPTLRGSARKPNLKSFEEPNAIYRKRVAF